MSTHQPAPAKTQESSGQTGTPSSFGVTNVYNDAYVKMWLRSLTILHRGHWNAARHFDRVNFGLGILTAIAATISGTTAFSQLQKLDQRGSFTFWLQVCVGILALIAAVLGAVQAFVRPSEMAATHKQAGQKFGKLRREVELYLELGLPADHREREKLLLDFQKRWNAVDEESIPVPKRIYHTEETRYDRSANNPYAYHHN